MREPTNESSAGVPPAQSALDWEKLRPVLDAAMHELKEADREAILLRYFENRQFAEVGAKLGLNENAARMRVERALEKLRTILGRCGVAATAALASVYFCKRRATRARRSGGDADDNFDCLCWNRNLHTYKNYDNDQTKTRH